jgi:hypothetical protein
MDAVITKDVELKLPQADLKFIKSLAKRMGWTIKSSKKKKTGIEKGLDDIKAGHLYHAENVDDLITQILG